MCITGNKWVIVDTKPSNQSNLHRQWWQGMTLRKFASQVQATNTLAMGSKQGYSHLMCMCTCLWSNLMTELNQKCTKSMPRRRLIHGIYTREKYLCKKFRIKEGEGVCSKGPYFWELTVKLLWCSYHDMNHAYTLHTHSQFSKVQ